MMFRSLIFSSKQMSMDLMSPSSGDPSRQALSGSTTLAPGRAVMMVPLADASLQMISDLELFKTNPNSSAA